MEELIKYWDRKLQPGVRRKIIYDKLPKGWSKEKKCFISARALERISILKRDRLAKTDSQYYYRELQKLKEIGK